MSTTKPASDEPTIERVALSTASGEPREDDPKEGKDFVTALARGLQVLSCFRSGHKLLGNQELAERCKLPKSTVSRLTATLTQLGYLVQVKDSAKYRLGTATLALGTAMLSQLDVRQLARPLMQELAGFAHGTVSLGARDRFSMIYIENCRSSAPLTLSMDVGSRIPIATSAMGRAYLAVVGERERREVMERVQEYDELAWPAIRAGIEKAMADHATLGVTCSFGDWQKDVNGIARAFNPGGGLPPMVINCGGPASSLSPQFLLEEVRPRLVELIARLETSLPG
ncbi:IclR family transcriptional regulator [Caldimonas brevitalea]|uniref:IclR family transcriptional regulator n=1 Tax=Caldimonas brevitalea TaxID=413882 RepID=A0A0G3BRF3_9BURK|nr:IclR family transcriptional regulator [Caldimonas brevitalea]AKJ29130.1 IclR family transcriptional regulator [Caldimonas brevitalea]